MKLLGKLYATFMRSLARRLGLTVVIVYRTSLERSYGAPPAGVQVQLATAEQLQPYAADEEYELSSDSIAAAFDRGDQCVATYLNGELAAYGWVSYSQAPHYAGLWVRFAEGQRYNYKSFTLPRFRGKHLRGSFGVLAACDTALGVTHTIEFIETHNVASMRAERRNGGRRVGFAGYALLPSGPLTFSSPGAKRYGFAFVKGSPTGQSA